MLINPFFMAEELQESEVIFQENAVNEEFPDQSNSRASQNTKLRTKKKKKNTVPVRIPENVSGNSWFQQVDSGFFGDEHYDDDDGEIVPPHVIVGRRIAGKMAFSVCTGNGRTLKGRDLSEVRNSILRMTGFLEA
ncbi:unnamed protein product [Ilex paraguariensis]|uniref:Senescence regulator n=1 Tax=Ilex paraguariensis TaxID=185542 RepID=A0ABC8SBY1_9AQUA